MPLAPPLPIFRTPAQAKVLALLFATRPGEAASLTAVAAATGVPLSTVQREVERLERSGLVSSTRSASARLVQANPDSPYFRDLSSLVLKALGPATVLARLLREIDGVEYAALFGSWARRYGGDDGAHPRDIDVLVVGAADADAVYAAAREAEGALNADVNPVLASTEEWAAAEDGFLGRIKREPLVDLVGV